jgi:hypothetical protein
MMQFVRRGILMSAVMGLAVIQVGIANAGGSYGYAGGHAAGCGGCGGCGPQYQTVQKTIYVSQMVPQTRIVNVTQYHNEVRQRNVTFHRRVPETKAVVENYTVMVPQKQTRTQNYTVNKQVWQDVQQNYVVRVPHQEVRQATRTVCTPVQVQKMRTVCRDQGYWETVTMKVPCGPPVRACGGCGGCTSCCVPQYKTVCRQVWRPNIVTEQVPVTVWQNQISQQPYQYTQTVYRPETRTRTMRVCKYVPETHTRQVNYVSYVPTKQSRTRNVTTYRTVAEQQVQNYTVCVPTTVQQEVTTMVCQMVPQTVTCQVLVSNCCH